MTTARLAGPPAPAFRLGYRPALDGVRGLAVLAVLGMHLAPCPFYGGYLGVDLFFVLSGFLVTTLLVQEYERTGTIRLLAFFRRRALRLLPALVGLLVAGGLYLTLVDGPAEGGRAAKAARTVLTFTHNWTAIRHTGPDWLQHTWSLAVEGQFYLVWAVTLAVLFRLGASRRVVLGVTGAGILGVAVWRAVMTRAWFAGPQWAALEAAYVRFDTRGDCLLTGCFAGLLASWDLLPTSARARAWLGRAALAAAVVLGYLIVEATFGPVALRRLSRGGFTLVAVMFATVLVVALDAPPRWLARVVEAAPVVRIGQLSYSLYLWHAPVAYELSRRHYLGFHSPGGTLFVQLAVALPLALVSYRYVEQPFLRRKARPAAPGVKSVARAA